MDAIKVLVAVFAFLGVLTVGYVNGNLEPVCRDEVICEPIDLNKGIDPDNTNDKPCCPTEDNTECKDCVIKRRGNLDMILAVPHAGIYTKFPFLNRTYGCDNGTKCAFNHDCYINNDPTQCKDTSCCLAGENVKSDFRSNEVAYRVYNYILENTGRCPSIIVSMPHRRWLDVNRYDDDGLATFGEEEMKKVYTQYHDGLTELVADVGGRPGILFDIHGHARKDWTMIGSMMTASELEDTTLLNSKADESSLKLLVSRTGATLGDLLQGEYSLGKYIEDAIVNGVPLEAVPSDTNLHPDGATYFAAEYSPITNGHRDNINVLQIEISSKGRITYQADYSVALGEAFLKFYERYFDGCALYPCGGTNNCGNEGSGFLCSCSNTNTCPATTCSGTNAVIGAQNVDYSPNKAEYSDGECIVYICKDGYQYSTGSMSRQCEGGSWSETAPICTACPLVDIANAVRFPDISSYDINDEITYTCAAGYTPEDSASMSRTCSESGWTGPVPACKDTDPCDPNPCGDNTGVHGTCSKLTTTDFKCDCDHRYIGTTCTEKLQDKTCDVEVPSWMLLNYVKDRYCEWQNRWREGSRCCKDINECDKNPCSEEADKCCINRRKDYECQDPFIPCWSKQFLVTLFDTRATWVPALAVFGSPAFYGFLFYSPIRAVIFALGREFLWTKIVKLIPGSVGVVFAGALTDESADVTQVIQEALDSANVTGLEIGSIETVTVTCELGQYILNDTCIDCPVGSYSDIRFAPSCIQCLPGYYQDEEKQYQCKPCQAGSFSSEVGSQRCTACSVGHFSQANAATCTPCGPGTFADAGGSSSCNACNPGTEPNASKTGCVTCLAGTFSETGVHCQGCLLGSVAEPGQSSCTPCIAGTKPSNDFSQCEECPAGTYSTNGLLCWSCSSGTISTAGSSICTNCAAGSIPNSAQSGCNSCQPGTWSNSGDHDCTACEDGHVSGEGAPSCTKCDGGTEPNGQKSACQACSAGSYSTNGVQCLPCATGTYSTIGSSSCLQCIAGSIPNSDQSGCSPCSPGTWSNSGDHECRPCEDGHVSGEGAPTCTKCDGGTEPNNEKSKCQACQAGSYSTNGVQCLPCATGTYSTIGSSSCLQCSAGSVPNPGQSGCDLCQPGTWSMSGDHQCRPCEDGHVSGEGAPSCTKCDGGTEPNGQKSACQACLAGSYSSDGVQCLPCATGTYSKIGSSSCLQCLAGSVPNSDQSGCDLCPPGTLSSSGDHECAQCQEGTVSPGGMPECTECNAGTVPNEEQSLCEECPAGHYSSAGDVSCSRCPRDLWSPPASEVCRECELGEMTLQDQSGCVQNIAFKKVAKQKGNNAKGKSSNKQKSYGPGNAIDGDFYNTCSRTKKTKNPWWKVRLGGWYNISTVVIIPTEECCGDELHDINVYVKPKGKNILCGKYIGPAVPGERIYMQCDTPIVGHRVKIKAVTEQKEVLVLCEVVVIGTPADEPEGTSSEESSQSETGSNESEKSKKSEKKSGKNAKNESKKTKSNLRKKNKKN